MKDYYYILGIDRNATIEQIKHAYRKLSLKFHPDKNDGDQFFENRFKEIQEAYEILSNVNKKIIYDTNVNNANFKSYSQNSSSYENKVRKDFEDEIKRRENAYNEKIKQNEKRHAEEVNGLKKKLKQNSIRKGSNSKRLLNVLLFLGIFLIASLILYSTHYSKVDKLNAEDPIKKITPKQVNTEDYLAEIPDVNTLQKKADTTIIDKTSKVKSQNDTSVHIQTGSFEIENENDCGVEYGVLTIYETTNDNFKFRITVRNTKGYDGNIDGLARVIKSDSSVYQDKNLCSLTFTFHDDKISVKESECSFYHGSNICFTGTYKTKY